MPNRQGYLCKWDCRDCLSSQDGCPREEEENEISVDDYQEDFEE